MDLKEEDLLKRNVKGIAKKLKETKVCILGLGGLGSNVAVLLARAGIGSLKLVDFDTVEASNLNRQQYRISHIGMKKTEAIKIIIKEINPFVEIEVLNKKIGEFNSEKKDRVADVTIWNILDRIHFIYIVSIF